MVNAVTRRKLSADLKAFAAFIETPADVSSGPFTMPAGARVAVSHSADIEAGQLRLVVTGPTDRTLATPTLAADQVFKGEFLERAVSFTVETDVAGDVTVYVLDEWTRPLEIAAGTFA